MLLIIKAHDCRSGDQYCVFIYLLRLATNYRFSSQELDEKRCQRQRTRSGGDGKGGIGARDWLFVYRQSHLRHLKIFS